MSLKLEELIKKNKKIVFFTGAGISTNSGIPEKELNLGKGSLGMN